MKISLGPDRIGKAERNTHVMDGLPVLDIERIQADGVRTAQPCIFQAGQYVPAVIQADACAESQRERSFIFGLLFYRLRMRVHYVGDG